MQYQEIKDYSGKVSCIKRSDGAVIPLDLDNTDYQVYLKWLEEGNSPLQADEVTQ
jgi:hypothetical protein